MDLVLQPGPADPSSLVARLLLPIPWFRATQERLVVPQGLLHRYYLADPPLRSVQLTLLGPLLR